MRMFRVRRALPSAVAIALLLPLATSWADVPPSWVQIAQPQDGAVSFGTAVVVNPRNGLVHVLGASFLSGSDYDLGLITYSEAGDNLRARSYQGPPGSSGSTNEYPGGIALDPATDTVYVTGVSEPDTGTTLVTLAYGRTGAAPVWAAEYALPENFDLYASRGIARNPVSGNLYVLAAAPAFVARDQLLLAYGPDGVLLWQATFGQPRDNESPVAVAVDSITGTVYTTGRKYNHASDDTSVYTTAYSTDGVLQWQNRSRRRGSGAGGGRDARQGVRHRAGTDRGLPHAGLQRGRPDLVVALGRHLGGRRGRRHRRRRGDRAGVRHRVQRPSPAAEAGLPDGLLQRGRSRSVDRPVRRAGRFLRSGRRARPGLE